MTTSSEVAVVVHPFFTTRKKPEGYDTKFSDFFRSYDYPTIVLDAREKMNGTRNIISRFRNGNTIYIETYFMNPCPLEGWDILSTKLKELKPGIIRLAGGYLTKDGWGGLGTTKRELEKEGYETKLIEGLIF